MNLDGETNLKEKIIPFNIPKDEISTTIGEIEYELPNENLDSWDGNISISHSKISINCSIKNVILRGCTLKNTEYIYGIVLYVGDDTKIMKNSK
jgi:magnesium-transporting ATPase (P-type)